MPTLSDDVSALGLRRSHRSGALLLATLVAVPGCLSRQVHQRSQTVTVRSDPAGAWLWQTDARGKRRLGPAPQTVEIPYQAVETRYNRWWWVVTALMGGVTGVGAWMMAEADWSEDPGVATGGLMMAIFGAGAALSGVMVGLIMEGASGEQDLPATTTIGASLAGHADVWAAVRVPGADKAVSLSLVPGGSPGGPGVGGGMVGKVVGAAASRPAAKARPIVAVFDVQDARGQLGRDTLRQLTDHLGVQLTARAGFRLVPSSQLRARLAREKRQSYRSCYEEVCQIELGKALAAQKSLATRILGLGQGCRIAAVLYDLKSETTDRAVSVRGPCTVEALSEGMEQVALDLAR